MATASATRKAASKARTQGVTRDGLRLVALVRISKDRDNETSTRTQPYEINAWAQAHGATIVETFVEEGRSGFKIIPRPKLDDALAMVRNGLADGIIVWKVDRFTRKGAMEIFAMLQTLNTTGGFLIATQDGIDTRDSGMASIIKLTVIAELAKAESELKSERATSWHNGRKRDKVVPNGRVPYGYDKPTANALVINEDEAAHVREMATGIVDGQSVRAMARAMNEAGKITKQGKPWSHATVIAILTSPTITGAREVDGALVDGDWPRVLDRETWHAVQDVLRDANRFYGNRPNWLLSYVMVCGKPDCGSQMKRVSRPSGDRYMCIGCGNSITMAIADEVVTAGVLDYLAGDGWKALRASGSTFDSKAVDFLTARLDHARNRWMDGKDSDAEYDAIKDELTARLAAIQSAPVVELPNVDDVQTAWNAKGEAGLTLEQKRQVIRAATESIKLVPAAMESVPGDRIKIAWTA